MRRLLSVSAALLIVLTTSAQSLKKYPVSNSGCFVYGYCEIKYELSKSADSSSIYSGECNKDEVTYGVICVK